MPLKAVLTLSYPHYRFEYGRGIVPTCHLSQGTT